MRLTLRTLLAYLDDTLDPAQAKIIGQKIAESEQARDLIERIQQVTRRRRITTPPDGGPGGKLDPNTLGEYLDNAVTPEQANEVEEICLASDTHLAEVAACHQILSLILGEPALVPPSARQRMYQLVKGPESIPFRKPPKVAAAPDRHAPEDHEADDTLRLGMPPVTGRHRGSPWMLIISGVTAACLLLIAIWQILQKQDETAHPNRNGVTIAQVEPNQDKKSPEPNSQDKTTVTPPEGNGNTTTPDEKKVTPMEEKKSPPPGKKTETPELPEVKLPPVLVDIPWTAPNMAVKPVGQLVAEGKQSAALLSYNPDKSEWERIVAKSPEVSSGRTLVSLPAAQNAIQLGKGLKLTLAGNMFPEMFPYFPLYESSVVLHGNDQLDLDVTLRRGRIRILSADGPARIRVRFDNPTQPNLPEFFDMTLQAAGTEVLMDRWFAPERERFYRNPKDPDRLGPVAQTVGVVLTGSVLFRYHDIQHNLTAPPGLALVAWNSRKGFNQTMEPLKDLPDGLTKLAPLPQGIDAKLRSDMLKARDDVQQKLGTKAVDVVVTEALKTNDAAHRRLACFSLGALDEISALVEQLEQEQVPELRTTAIDALRHWIAADRDNEHKLFELLKEKYRTVEADNILTLLHQFSEKDLKNPDTYDLLIGYLNSPQLALRELASWHLYQLVPLGQKIRYNASADAATRQQAQASWRALIPAGQLPPPAPKK